MRTKRQRSRAGRQTHPVEYSPADGRFDGRKFEHPAHQNPTHDVDEPQRRRPVLPWVIAGVLLFAIGTAFILRQAEVMAVRKRLLALREEIQYYTSMNESLAEQIEVLKSDQYVEKTARDKLGLVMPGEIQYMLVVTKIKD